MNVSPIIALNELRSSKTIPCVSIFLPTHRAGKEIEQDRIRFKNLLREAEQQLVRNRVRFLEAKKILEPASPLLEDSFFWRHQSDGLAVFIAPGFFRYYRVPMSFDERIVVSDQFHIMPLLPMFMTDGRFYVLSLNMKQIQLFRCTHLSIKEVDLHNVMTNIEELQKYNMADTELNYHSVGVKGSGSGTAMFHGHGAGTDDAVKKKGVLDFFQQVNRSLIKILNSERAPMVLAGVEYLRSIYKEANTYSGLVDEGIDGISEIVTVDQLHSRAWEIMEPIFRKSFENAVAQYRQAMNTPRASQNLREILQAVHAGRVETLFVANGLAEWGTFNPQSGSLVLHDDKQPGDKNLQDYAIIQTLSKGGAVYVVEPRDAPIHTPLAAIYRY